MGHYAKIEQEMVVEVVVADEDWVAKQEGEWLQTSYNTRGGVHYGPDGQPDGGVALRKNYAGAGMFYDRTRDAFIYKKPYQSWILNEDSCLWQAPVPYPDDGKNYRWDDVAQQWALDTNSL